MMWPSLSLPTSTPSSHYSMPLIIEGLNSLEGQIPIEIPYPACTDFAIRTLPVCTRCKSAFKTKAVCRRKYQHRSLPWCPVYLCITLDHSCSILTSDNKNSRLWRGPFRAECIRPCLSFKYTKNVTDPNVPICHNCKDTNQSKQRCRQNRRHRDLPWGTVHILLQAAPGCQENEITTTDNNSDNINHNDRGRPTKRRRTDINTTLDDNNNKNDEKVEETNNSTPIKQEDDDDDYDKKNANVTFENHTNKFQNIPASRTFLATVSAKNISIEWLDCDSNVEAMLNQKKRGSNNNINIDVHNDKRMSFTNFDSPPLPPPSRHHLLCDALPMSMPMRPLTTMYEEGRNMNLNSNMMMMDRFNNVSGGGGIGVGIDACNAMSTLYSPDPRMLQPRLLDARGRGGGSGDMMGPLPVNHHHHHHHNVILVDNGNSRRLQHQNMREVLQFTNEGYSEDAGNSSSYSGGSYVNVNQMNQFMDPLNYNSNGLIGSSTSRTGW